MSGQGDAILRDLVEADIKRLEGASEKSPCAQCGMLTLLKCKKEEMKNGRKGSALPLTGWGMVISSIAYLILKAHNIVP
jgi:hypothetical protein